jgi:NitT/TauT family transport system permease protein
MKKVPSFIFPTVSGITLIAAWYSIIALFNIPIFVLPRPDQILEAAWVERKTLITSALITSQGAFAGFILAVLGGFLISIIMAFSSKLKKSLYPYILILQMTPVIILAPIFCLWLGQGLPSIIAITFMICFFPIVASTTLGFTSVDQNLLEVLKSCNATRLQEIKYLRIPYALPYFLNGVKIAGTLAPIGAITGDFLAGSSQNGIGGIGFMAITYFSQLKTSALYATGAFACLLGFIFVGSISLVHWLFLHKWHDSLIKKN